MDLTYVELAWHVPCYLSLTTALVTKTAHTSVLSHECYKKNRVSSDDMFHQGCRVNKEWDYILSPRNQAALSLKCFCYSLFWSVFVLHKQTWKYCCIGKKIKDYKPLWLLCKCLLKVKDSRIFSTHCFVIFSHHLKNEKQKWKPSILFFSERIYLLFLLKLLSWQTVRWNLS